MVYDKKDGSNDFFLSSLGTYTDTSVMGFSENAFWQGSTWLGQYNYDVIQLLQRSLSHAFGCHGWVVQIWKHIICMVSLPRLPYFKRRIHGRQTCLFYHDRVFEFR